MAKVMYKIGFEDKMFIFRSPAEHIDTPSVNVAVGERISPAKLLEKIENSNTLCVISDNPQESFRLFCGQFEVVEAGGGLVESGRRMMMIMRNGRWDLPKGHLERGETLEQCAVREVGEETGLAGLRIVEYLGITQHFHNAYGRWEIKRTHWYLMSCENLQTCPQTDEGISKAEWLRGEDLWQAVDGSYSSIKYIFERLIEMKNR